RPSRRFLLMADEAQAAGSLQHAQPAPLPHHLGDPGRARLVVANLLFAVALGDFLAPGPVLGPEDDPTTDLDVAFDLLDLLLGQAPGDLGPDQHVVQALAESEVLDVAPRRGR